jgi:Fe-S cluster assembly iron-binding protein IscA
MKHILVLVAILLSLSSVNAQDNTYAYNEKAAFIKDETPVAAASFKLEIAQVNQEDLVFRITVENPGSEKVILSIKDANNVVLHQESLPATLVYKAKFNLQGLEDGNYTFEIRKGKTRLAEKSIDIRTETSINRTVSVQ